MKEPRATWVLWIEGDVGDWEPAYEVMALASWANGRELLVRYVRECTGFGEDFKVLPAGRKPKGAK